MKRKQNLPRRTRPLGRNNDKDEKYSNLKKRVRLEEPSRNYTQFFQRPSNPIEGMNFPEPCSLKKPGVYSFQFVDDFETSGFVNLRNEFEDGNMPVILNTFSLSEISQISGPHAGHMRARTTTSTQENNGFLVTPSRSPPLVRTSSFIREHSYKDNFSSTLGNPIVDHPAKFAKTNQLHSYNIANFPQKITYGVIDTPQNTSKYQEKYLYQHQPNRYNVIHPASTNARNFDGDINGSKYLAERGRFVSQGNKLYANFKLQRGYSSKDVKSAKRQYVLEKIIQRVERNHHAKNKLPRKRYIETAGEHTTGSWRQTSSSDKNTRRYPGHDTGQYH